MKNYRQFTALITVLILGCVMTLLVVQSPYWIAALMLIIPSLMLTFALGILQSPNATTKTLDDGWFDQP